MYNWSTDEKAFKKKYPKEYKLWRLTQLINYGLDGEKRLDKDEIKKVWPKIKDRLDTEDKISGFERDIRGTNFIQALKWLASSPLRQ